MKRVPDSSASRATIVNRARMSLTNGSACSPATFQTCLVMNMVSVKHWHEYRRIEKPLHSTSPKFARSRSSRISRSKSSVTAAGRDRPVRSTQTHSL